MRRKPNDPAGGGGAGRRTLLIFLLIAFLSCSLVYTALSFAFRRPGSSSSLSFGSSWMSSDGEAKEIEGVEKSSEEEEEEKECCRGLKNLELWGSAVKWGTDHKFSSSWECCRACKAMCGGSDGPCLCDSWVFCGDRESCGGKFGECWLKKQKDVLSPALQESGDKVIWTSGLIFGKGEGIVGLETDFGTLHIKLLPDCAPHSVAYIVELLGSRHCAGCQIYRAEGRGHSWDAKGNHIVDVSLQLVSGHSWDAKGNHIVDAPFGPPYAILQGTLEAEGVPFKNIPKEACPTLRRGSVAWIGSGPEFIVSLADHDEWRKAYTVFGSVLPEDMHIAEKITDLPTKSDVWSDVNVSVLEKPIHLRLRRIKGNLNLGGNTNS